MEMVELDSELMRKAERYWPLAPPFLSRNPAPSSKNSNCGWKLAISPSLPRTLSVEASHSRRLLVVILKSEIAVRIWDLLLETTKEILFSSVAQVAVEASSKKLGVLRSITSESFPEPPCGREGSSIRTPISC